MFEARATRKAAIAANRLSVEQLEAILKAKKASDPGILDVTLKSLDEAQVWTRQTVSDGLGWLASCIRP